MPYRVGVWVDGTRIDTELNVNSSLGNFSRFEFDVQKDILKGGRVLDLRLRVLEPEAMPELTAMSYYRFEGLAIKHLRVATASQIRDPSTTAEGNCNIRRRELATGDPRNPDYVDEVVRHIETCGYENDFVLSLSLELMRVGRNDLANRILSSGYSNPRTKFTKDDALFLYFNALSSQLVGESTDRVVQLFNEAEGYGFSGAALYLNRGRAFENDGKTELARREYMTAIEKDPGLSSAKSALEQLGAGKR